MSEIPTSWTWATVGAVADVSGGLTKNAVKRDASKVRVPLVSVAAVQLRRIHAHAVGEVGLLDSDGDRATLEPGDLLIVEGNGSLEHIGRVALWNDEVPGARHQNHIIRVRPRGLSSRFVLEWLASPSGRVAVVNEATSAAGLYTLSISKVQRLPIPVPPPIEQVRIVAKVDALQTRSRRAREALDAVPPLLEKLRQSILAAAFRGDLTKDWRAKNKNVEPATKLLARIRTERRKKWEEAELAKMSAKGKAPTEDAWKAKYKEPEPVDASGLPELPEGWCWASLDELTFLVGGVTKGQKRKSTDVIRHVPYLRVANVQRGHLDLEDVKTIEATDPEATERRLVPGDILLNEGGDRDKLGRGWIWEGQLAECIHQNHVFRARPVSEDLQPRYISHYANHLGQAFFVDQGKQTTNLASVSMSRVRRFPVALPSAEEQAAIVALLDQYFASTDAHACSVERFAERLAELNRSILAKAFRGELVAQCGSGDFALSPTMGLEPTDLSTPKRTVTVEPRRRVRRSESVPVASTRKNDLQS